MRAVITTNLLIFQAGTAGTPATPRDGAAVELIGLLKSTLRFIISLPQTVWEYEYANKSSGLTYRHWNDIIQDSFCKHFYIGDPNENRFNDAIDAKLVNKTHIFRDTLKVRDAQKINHEFRSFTFFF